jgi:integrase/recombinase XerD
MVILNVMSAWLVKAGYLAGNPLSLTGSPRGARNFGSPANSSRTYGGRSTSVHRYDAPRDRPATGTLPPRALAVHPGVSGWVADPEVSANTMGRFFARRDADGDENWWLEVLGKGDKEGLVSATNAIAAAHS